MSDRIVELAKKEANGYDYCRSVVEPFNAAILFSDLVPDEAKRAAILDRQHAKGLAKYGTGLADCGLTRQQLLDHAAEEAADLLCYLLAAKEAPDA